MAGWAGKGGHTPNKEKNSTQKSNSRFDLDDLQAWLGVGWKGRRQEILMIISLKVTYTCTVSISEKRNGKRTKGKREKQVKVPVLSSIGYDDRSNRQNAEVQK